MAGSPNYAEYLLAATRVVILAVGSVLGTTEIAELYSLLTPNEFTRRVTSKQNRFFSLRQLNAVAPGGVYDKNNNALRRR